MFRRCAILAAAFLATASSNVDAGRVPYEVSVDGLNKQDKELFLKTRKTLNDWNGGREKLETGRYMIESFIASRPNFLPIYIEKARMTIMWGFVTGRTEEANRQALEIIEWIRQKDPGYPKSYVLAGHIFTNLGDYARARKSLEKAETLTNSDPWLYLNWAGLAAAERRFPEVIEYAERGLALAKDNAKALIAALILIDKISQVAGAQDTRYFVVPTVFKYYRSPQERIRIAERLIDEWSGRSEQLDYAYRIILEQKAEMPELPEADLQMARVVLYRGFRSSRYGINNYVKRFSVRAENILWKIKDDPAVADRAIELLVGIAMGDRNYFKARILLEDAEKKQLMPDRRRKMMLAHIMFAEGDYAQSAAMYEQLGFSHHHIQAAAYAKMGRVDKLEEFHLQQVKSHPDSAWTLGNYANFLLHTKGDLDESIEYASMALQLMPYYLAKQYLGLAYLVKASRSLKDGDPHAARDFYNHAVKAGYDPAYVRRACGKYCFEIWGLDAEMEEASAPAWDR